jgi:CRISPR type IV-associated protein Csf3
MTWWGLGDISEVTRLLSRITHLGKKRSVGNGNVNAWDVRRVDESECWEGFPVMRDGFPLRHLPLDFPGVNPEATRRIGCLTYPYWLTSAEQEVYAPA